MKYWNERRIRRIRESEKRKEAASAVLATVLARKARTYTAGDSEKNAHLMFDALGLSLRRKLLIRLRKEGAMSLSKLGRPFGMKLPTLYMHMQILERVGLITTHKRGRVRMCIFNQEAFNELSVWLVS